jgi:hypothetical protein
MACMLEGDSCMETMILFHPFIETDPLCDCSERLEIEEDKGMRKQRSSRHVEWIPWDKGMCWLCRLRTKGMGEPVENTVLDGAQVASEVCVHHHS